MTALAVPEGLEPLAVWDCPGERGPWCRRAKPETERSARMTEAVFWVARNLTPAADIYRIDFYLHDAPFAVAYRYKRNDSGHKYNGPDGEIATEPPVIVPLAELPPDHLLKG